jgi:predicted acyl esterase
MGLCLAIAVMTSQSRAALPPTAPTYGVRIEKTLIRMKDGVRLAVTLYRPDIARTTPRFPALLEYIPYRKDDGTLPDDYGNYMYFARRGYVGARVDIRGFGNSEGTPTDREYSAQEQADGEQIIAWLARQPWSNGKVGMLGISWGGFNSIQMALRKPPALKAIIAVDATEELYTEDVHGIDGIFHFDEYELTMDLDQGRSGAPDFSLEETVIGPRMDSLPWSLNYLRHQSDGAFWRAPLVRPIEQLDVPTFLIGGFQDGYRDSIPRMLDKVKAPIKAWVGPWNHNFPNGSDYGPLYEWRDQAVRWFDYWLKGRDTGVLQDPKLVVYLQHSHPPDPQAKQVPGEWRAEQWPPQGLAPTTLYLQTGHRLSADNQAEGKDELRYVPSAGVEAGFWWGELLSDQRPADAYSLSYDSQVLGEDIAVLGRPQVHLQAAADAPLADWFVRLSDVAPDGQVTLVTGAGVNGAQRNSRDTPQDLTPGKIYPLSMDLHLASWVFPKGHRIRVAVSNALWPMLWPTPYPMTTSLVTGGSEASRITLPRIPVHGVQAASLAAPEPIEEVPDITEGHAAWPGDWTVLRDEAHQRSTVIWQGKSDATFPWGRFDHSERITYEIDDAHPDSARVKADSEYNQTVHGQTLSWRGHHELSGDAHTFFYQYTRALLRDGTVVRTKTWTEAVPRDHQ